MPLSPEEIDALLKGELKKSTGGDINVLPRPKQLGPLRWRDERGYCTSRGCGSPCLIEVRGVYYCTTHALNVLNRIILEELEHVDLSECTCKAGVHSKGNIHTYDCAMYEITADEFVEELL